MIKRYAAYFAFSLILALVISGLSMSFALSSRKQHCIETPGAQNCQDFSPSDYTRDFAVSRIPTVFASTIFLTLLLVICGTIKRNGGLRPSFLKLFGALMLSVASGLILFGMGFSNSFDGGTFASQALIGPLSLVFSPGVLLLKTISSRLLSIDILLGAAFILHGVWSYFLVCAVGYGFKKIFKGGRVQTTPPFDNAQ